MLFNSKIFILAFLPIILVGFFVVARLAGERAARLWLLIGSFVFYGWWSVTYLVILILWMLMNFAFGRKIMAEREKSARASAPWLAASVIANLGLLGYYKYAAFIVDGVNQLTGFDFVIGAIVLPLAISFHTFQQIAYLIDVQRQKAPKYSAGDYLLFVSFFPQLIAGPIVHHYELVPQLHDKSIYRFNQVAFSEGLAFFIFGLVKKLCLADPLSSIATPVFSTAAADPPTLFSAWAATLAFSLGLYFDFSGYSDMAIGLARMFGIRLPYNFNSPYKAASITDFWRRWHMTLSRWLRDYLYISLGGNRKGAVRRYINLFLTMLLGGLWHGAAWTFVAWGALHGAYLIVNHAWNALSERMSFLRLGRVASTAITLFAVMMAWVFFASPSFPAALGVFEGMAGLHGLIGSATAMEVALTQGPAAALAHYGRLDTAFGLMPYATIFLGAAIVLFAPNTQQIIDGRAQSPSEAPAFGRLRFTHTAATAVAAAASLFFALSLMSDVKEFVYFQF